jgi:hypothetical protein
MKKIFFSLVFAMLASCSDMALEDATKQELPDDFKVSDYSKINPDVASAQLALSIKALEPAGTTPSARTNDCKQQFSDIDFVEEVYSKYAGCPQKKWDINQPCEGQEAFIGWNNAAYSDNGKCRLPGCFAGGWGLPECNSLMECDDMGFGDEFKKTLKHTWPTLGSGDTTFTLVCAFNVFGRDSKEYINNYKYDSTLIAKHFILAGRYEGRPYRYCGSNDFDQPRSSNLAKQLTGSGGKFYDYSANLFCLSDFEKGGDGKVYRIK